MKKPRIYIVPTKFGAGFILGAALMILIGASYQNNLVNLLAFFMLSLVFIGMIQTHLNLKDVTLAGLDVANGFAGEDFVTTIVLQNGADEPRYNLEATLRKQKPKVVYENVLPLAARATLKLRSSYAASGRGRYKTSAINVASEYPLGLFRSWIILKSEAPYFIYPRAQGTRALPSGSVGQEIGTGQLIKGGEDFHGHRKFQAGDSSRQIDWKAHARGRTSLVKEFNEGSTATLELDWSALPDLPLEERLSQLAAWVVEAKRHDRVFTLRLPNRSLGPAQGSVHEQRCLETLAEYGVPHAP